MSYIGRNIQFIRFLSFFLSLVLLLPLPPLYIFSIYISLTFPFLPSFLSVLTLFSSLFPLLLLLISPSYYPNPFLIFSLFSPLLFLNLAFFLFSLTHFSSLSPFCFSKHFSANDVKISRLQGTQPLGLKPTKSVCQDSQDLQDSWHQFCERLPLITNNSTQPLNMFCHSLMHIFREI